MFYAVRKIEGAHVVVDAFGAHVIAYKGAALAEQYAKGATLALFAEAEEYGFRLAHVRAYLEARKARKAPAPAAQMELF